MIKRIQKNKKHKGIRIGEICVDGNITPIFLQDELILCKGHTQKDVAFMLTHPFSRINFCKIVERKTCRIGIKSVIYDGIDLFLFVEKIYTPYTDLNYLTESCLYEIIKIIYTVLGVDSKFSIKKTVVGKLIVLTVQDDNYVFTSMHGESHADLIRLCILDIVEKIYYTYYKDNEN